MLQENTFEKTDFNAAKGLVFIGNKIIVYRRDQKTDIHPLRMDLPGGLREDGESPFDTFKREVREEFGIAIQKEDLCFSSTYEVENDPDMRSYFIVTKPLAIDVADIVFGDEGTEWFLMSPDEFIARPDGIEVQQRRVADYLAGKLHNV